MTRHMLPHLSRVSHLYVNRTQVPLVTICLALYINKVIRGVHQLTDQNIYNELGNNIQLFQETLWDREGDVSKEISGSVLLPL